MHLGIDLGTSTVLIYVKGKGVVLREPSVVALDKSNNKIVAVGEQAMNMLGKTPGNIIAIRPMRDGVIADYEITEAMLRHFMTRVCGRTMLIRPQVMVCVPAEVTSVEKRAVLEAALAAGARRAYLIEEPMAAAIGAGLAVDEPEGNLVVDIGGGTTDIAVIAMGGIVVSQSLRVAGNKMDEAIVRYLRKNYNLMIGERTAETIKMRIGAAWPGEEIASMEIRGRDLIDGLPKTMAITSDEVREALEEPVGAIVDAVKSVLEHTPPELAADILKRGVVLTGGGALLKGLDTLLSRTTGTPARVADDPVCCVAIGTGKAESLKL